MRYIRKSKYRKFSHFGRRNYIDIERLIYTRHLMQMASECGIIEIDNPSLTNIRILARRMRVNDEARMDDYFHIINILPPLDFSNIDFGIKNNVSLPFNPHH